MFLFPTLFTFGKNLTLSRSLSIFGMILNRNRLSPHFLAGPVLVEKTLPRTNPSLSAPAGHLCGLLISRIIANNDLDLPFRLFCARPSRLELRGLPEKRRSLDNAMSAVTVILDRATQGEAQAAQE